MFLTISVDAVQITSNIRLEGVTKLILTHSLRFG